MDTARDPRSALSSTQVVEMLDQLYDGILVLDLDWRISYISVPAAEMLGRQAGELRGLNLWGEFPEAVGGTFHIAYEEALADGKPRQVIEYYKGSEQWFEGRAFPYEDRLVVLFRNVTEPKRAKIVLERYLDGVAAAEQIIGFGIWRWNVLDDKVTWSDELHRIYGLEPGEFEGTAKGFADRLHPDDRERVWGEISRSLETLEPFLFRERIIRPDGSVRILLSQGRVLTAPDGTPESLVGVCHDLTERVAVEAALGASERRMRAIVDSTPSMISVKDLDGRFLMSNAEFDRVVGQAGAEIVGSRCGDVFPAEIAAAQRARDLRAASTGEPVYGETVLPSAEGPRTYVTATFALPDDHGIAVETCTIATDITERREQESERRERRLWTERISSAIGDGRMVVLAQPIIDLASGDPVSNELLVRIRTKGRQVEILSPDAFLPAAERFDLVQSIDTWMVGQALATDAAIPLHVNLSAVTVCDPAACREIVAMLAASPEDARRIVFEITETASATQLVAAQAFGAEVTELGCRLALDDFGVGFGSFTYLRSLPISFIKIDRGFVGQLAHSAEDRRVVQGIVSVAKGFGIETIAEGIEDEETLDVLREFGVDRVQGFLLGRPAPLQVAIEEHRRRHADSARLATAK
jgi:PAS domain S-box-containing protein